MNSLELETYEILKNRLDEQKALTILQFADAKAEQKINEKRDVFLTKDDKIDILKWMFGIFLAQMAAIIGLYFKR
jgi:hypothetical protein